MTYLYTPAIRQQISKTLIPWRLVKQWPVIRNTVAIDPPDADERDDAFVIKPTLRGYNLIVCIPFVSFLIRPGSPIDLKARDQGYSLYLPNNEHNLFPPEILGQTSLDHLNRRLSLAIDMQLDKEGNLLGQEVYPAVAEVAAALDYQDADEIIYGKNKGHYMFETLRDSSLVGQRLQLLFIASDSRVAADFSDFILTDEDGFRRHLPINKRYLSYLYVRNFMLLANRAACQALLETGGPVLYRSHPNFVPELAGVPLEPINGNSFRARYSLENHGHYGLGLNAYLHITSPLRRYADVVNQWLFVRAFGWDFGFPPLPPRETLQEIATHLSEREREVQHFSQLEKKQSLIPAPAFDDPHAINPQSLADLIAYSLQSRDQETKRAALSIIKEKCQFGFLETLARVSKLSNFEICVFTLPDQSGSKNGCLGRRVVAKVNGQILTTRHLSLESSLKWAQRTAARQFLYELLTEQLIFFSSAKNSVWHKLDQHTPDPVNYIQLLADRIGINNSSRVYYGRLSTRRELEEKHQVKTSTCRVWHDENSIITIGHGLTSEEARQDAAMKMLTKLDTKQA